MYHVADVDECAEGNGGCDEKCNNTVGSFHCACTDGFEVATDGKTCIGKSLINSPTYPRIIYRR